MSRLEFGAFLAPHHPIGEHPMLQYRRDLDLVEHLDKLGFHEFWCGEHHSTGWEMIASPEMFLAAAAERSHTIKLGTGVVSLPYHHPFNVAERLVQLDYMSNGRAIFGSGPGALPSDAHTLGIHPSTQRDRQDEAMGVIRRLMRGEAHFDYECEWFTLKDAALQLLPLQEDMPFAVASTISPSGMTLAGKYGCGVLSIGSMSEAGLDALPTQWSFAEESAEKHGQTVDRKDWRILMNFHLAETRERAREEAKHGLFHWHNEYTVKTLMRPGADEYKTPDEAVDQMAGDGSPIIVGTPDDMVEAILRMKEITGGFGTSVGFVHDWCSREANFRSWELFAMEVIPRVNGLLDAYNRSRNHVIENREVFNQAGQAVLTKIMEHEGAAKAMAEGMAKAEQAKSAIAPHHAPDLSKGEVKQD